MRQFSPGQSPSYLHHAWFRHFPLALLLFLACLALDEPEYLELWKKLPPDPTDPEVRRNIAITQPILWLQ